MSESEMQQGASQVAHPFTLALLEPTFAISPFEGGDKYRLGPNEKPGTIVTKPLPPPEMPENDQCSSGPLNSLSPIVRHPGNPQAGIHPDRRPRQRSAQSALRMDSRQKTAGMTECRLAAGLAAARRLLRCRFAKQEIGKEGLANA